MPANHVMLASGAIVAVSAVVATAIAIYESPELRRYTDDVRRRIALALQSIGDGIHPPDREPVFNRPEDAEGFLESRRGAGAEPGVDADEATRRSQREELMYWNSVKLQRQLEDELTKHAERQDGTATPVAEERPHASRGTSFDDFLKPAQSEESGAYVVSGAQAPEAAGELRHRGDGARGLAAAMYANPFADENHIDPAELGNMGIGTGRLLPESHSDIYSATTKEEDRQTATTATMEEVPSLIDFGTESSSSVLPSPAAVQRELESHALPAEEVPAEAYASIQAWARDSGFYSPLPVTPLAPASEAEVISEGELTPTDSVSLVGEDVDGRADDVMSETDGMLTPASWSEVGSQISESEQPQPQLQHA